MDQLAQALVSGILVGGVYGLVSMGLSLVFGVVRIINFAHGDLVMLGMYGAFVLWIAAGINPLVSALIMAALLFILGVILYRVFFERVVTGSSELVPQLSLTVGISFMVQTIAQWIFSPNHRSITVPSTTTYYTLGPVFVSQAQLIAFAVSLGVSIVMWLFFGRTAFGRGMRAMVDDRDVAQTLGINSRKMYTFALAASASLAGVGGAILMSYYSVFPHVGLLFLPLSFVAVVMGGMGNVLGAFIGGVVVGVIQQLSGTYISFQLQNAGLLVAFMLILLVKPTGLFGKEGVL